MNIVIDGLSTHMQLEKKYDEQLKFQEELLKEFREEKKNEETSLLMIPYGMILK